MKTLICVALGLTFLAVVAIVYVLPVLTAAQEALKPLM